MKKLLDDNTDELTRALLEAGRSHRPPASNRGRLLVALGASSGVALLSSKAFAWLGTSTGKLSVLGVGVGVAGVLYGALPAEPAARSTSAGVEQVEARVSPATSGAVSSVATLSAVPSAAPPLSVPAHVASVPSPLGRDPVAGLPAVNEGSVRRENAPASNESPHRAARVRKSSVARRDDVRERGETKGVEGPPADSPAPAATSAQASEARAPGLDSEIQLVDAMRGAAQRNDARALRDLVASYRYSFPDGQLRAEVAELALRALPSSR
jgi:hypothetical protein